MSEAPTTVLFFGRVGERLGRERVLERLEAATVGELRRRLAGAGPEAAILLDPSVRTSVDRQMVGDDAPLRPGQEIAFFPPFSGG